jgi:cell division protein FtsB
MDTTQDEAMTGNDEGLYGLMAVAQEQQQAVQTALAGLAQRETALAATVARLQTLEHALVPAVQKAAHAGAVAAMQRGLADASQTVLAGMTTQAAAAETRLRNAVAWFTWRWAALAGALVLAVAIAAWSVVAWQRSQIAALQVEREQWTAEVDAAQATVAQLEKKTGGVHYLDAANGRFIVARRGFEAMTCDGVPCIRLK